MVKGKIIFLNGVSSTGKTSLAKALQERLDEPYYVINVDSFLGTGIMFPEKFATADDAGYEMFLRTSSGMHHVIKLYSDMGLNTIVDHCLVSNFFDRDPKGLEECVELLHEYPVLFVHVTCPIEELRRREKERGDRRIGQAKEQLSILVPQDTYDITIDTHNESKDACIERIVAAFKYPDQLTAFKTLWSQQHNRTE